MHLYHFPQCTIQNRNGHISVQWCIVRYGTGAFEGFVRLVYWYHEWKIDIEMHLRPENVVHHGIQLVCWRMQLLVNWAIIVSVDGSPSIITWCNADLLSSRLLRTWSNKIKQNECPKHLVEENVVGHFVQASIRRILHEDVIKWRHFPRYWPFARGIPRSPVNSPHKGRWYGALMFSLILNKRLSKPSWGWWFEAPSRSLWRHCNEIFEKVIWACNTQDAMLPIAISVFVKQENQNTPLASFVITLSGITRHCNPPQK